MASLETGLVPLAVTGRWGVPVWQGWAWDYLGAFPLEQLPLCVSTFGFKLLGDVVGSVHQSWGILSSSTVLCAVGSQGNSGQVPSVTSGLAWLARCGGGEASVQLSTNWRYLFIRGLASLFPGTVVLRLEKWKTSEFQIMPTGYPLRTPEGLSKVPRATLTLNFRFLCFFITESILQVFKK